MKTYILSFADSINHKPEHPERTAKRNLSWDVQYQVWPNNASMLKTIELQQRRASKQNDWIACK